MKNIYFLLIALTCSLTIKAQKNEEAKTCFYNAKTQLEVMLDGSETPDFEKAIFTIENAWYENNVSKQDFDRTIETYIGTIRNIIKQNNNPAIVKQKPNYLLTQKQIDERYTKALTNWAIYTFMTKDIYTIIDSENVHVHYAYNYSRSDPMASNDWSNTQVINLHNTKSGNCFALASLFKILSNRLNSEASLCTAPSHIYIRHADEKGAKYNVELGTRNFPGTGAISTVTYSTDQAIKNSISQCELTSKQEIALCLVYLAKGYEHKFQSVNDPFILECAETALQYDNRNLNALLLKAEFLESKLVDIKKSVSLLQNNKDFQVYQTLVSNIYDLGYREMPLDMKNLLIRSYIQDKSQEKHTPVNPITSTGRYATLSWGMFDERHEKKATERIGNTIYNTKTKKITAFGKNQELYNNYDFDPVVFAWNIDPMATAYPGLSPYSFAANNPIMFTDSRGAYVEGRDGKPVTYKMLTNGKIQWSANASADTRKIGNAMLKTTTGREQYKKMQETSYPIATRLNKPKDGDFGKTDVTWGKDKDGKDVVTRVDMYVNENSMKMWKSGMDAQAEGIDDVKGVLKKNIASTPDGEEKQGYQYYLLMTSGKWQDALGATGSHEAEHATNMENMLADKANQDNKKDPQPEYKNKDVESVPNEVEQKDLDERTK